MLNSGGNGPKTQTFHRKLNLEYNAVTLANTPPCHIIVSAYYVS